MQPNDSNKKSCKEHYQLVIVGAGMSGLCMGAQAKQADIHDFLILEKSHDLGGTWLNNRYPGAHCDVPSHLYSFSFAPKSDWSEKFASASEIHTYMHQCADRFKLREHFRFNCAITAADFDETNNRWTITTSDQQKITAQFLVLSTAPLNEPNMPTITGLESFTKPLFHTAQWPKNIDLTGKHVAIIGSAASAVQVVPQIAASVASLTIYQRTPNWVLPRGNKSYGASRLNWFSRPAVQKLYRGFLFCLHEANRLGFSRGTFFSSITSGIAATLAKRHLRKQINNPDLQAQLSPQYNFGCKRVLVSDDFYPSLNRPNVNVVTDPIASINSLGIRTASGKQFEHDAIVCATGFKLDHFAHAVSIKGLNGHTLQSVFSDGPKAYLGTVVPQIPNLFMLLGPNTATGHTSTLLYIEAQVKMSLKLIATLKQHKQQRMVVKPAVFEQYDQQLQAKFAKTSWSGSCLSWYKTESGRNIAIWPGSTRQFWKALNQASLDDFEVA
jgi:cation diffusion facilitator CzcD-associated flavoprotein CzcO